MSDELVLTHREPLTEGHTTVITLNRPAKLNAWTSAMRARIVELLTEAGADPDCRAVVLTGTGDAFCAGQDLAETRAIDPGDHAAAEAWIDEFDVLYRALRGVDKPTVAAVNGVAAGSGFQLALLADLRVGHPGVRMGQPEVRSGIPSVTGIWAMWDILGKARTIEFTLTGDLVDGTEAHRLGLLTRLVPERGDVLAAALDLAASLASLPPGAVALTKARLREIDDAALTDAVTAAKDVHARAYASGEPQREMERFLAKRR
ncbi:enoyl-CoA hydratase/isomerase family protein [Nocardiopsis dassonvillei]|uniref:enoyl-CoA hydratase/isomerase family protein n=1 Tax=Nocardiopsis dassonvillei TaxID=2014 RepID=UPI0036F8DC34